MVIRPLSDLEPPEKGIIVRVGGKGEIRRRLLDMGVITGANVEVLRVAPLGDPVEIRVKGYDLALRKGEADNIQVELTEGVVSRLDSGTTAIVTHVRAGWGLQRRLADLGIVPGVEVKIAGGHGGQVVLQVKGSRLALGRGVAGKIIARIGGVKDE